MPDYNKALIWSDYRMWAFLFIVVWFLAGAIPSAAVVRLFFEKRGVR